MDRERAAPNRPRRAFTLGYLGSHGGNLRISRNLNQPVNGVRPALSLSSTILPGAHSATLPRSRPPASRTTTVVDLDDQAAVRGCSWTARARCRRRSTPTLNSSGFVVQNSYDIPNQYGLSDSMRASGSSSQRNALPFMQHADADGGNSPPSSGQSGNPVNIVTSTAALNGTQTPFVRMSQDLSHHRGSVDRWFDQRSSWPSTASGIWAGTWSLDQASQHRSVDQQVRSANGHRFQFRVDALIFNHPNLAAGQRQSAAQPSVKSPDGCRQGGIVPADSVRARMSF
jgi:hypothetical protein